MVNLSSSIEASSNNHTPSRRMRPSKSRSKSSSSGFSNRRRYRSRSRERYKSRGDYKDRDNYCRRSKYDARRSSSLSPLLQRKRLGNGKFSFPDSESRFSRLRKPEIQDGTYSADDIMNDRIRTATLSIENESGKDYRSISLSERFTRYTTSGTAIFNKRRHSRTSDNFRIPHLILTNNTRLPPATLMRQAKEISIVIERTFPLSADKLPDCSKEFSLNEGRLIIPRYPTEGYKPVFDRPEIKLYNTPSEESCICKRLTEAISAINSKQSSQYRHKTNKIDYHDISQFIGPGRFYGSRVEERLVDSKNAFPLDPAEIPKGQSYYLHDNRGEDSYKPRRRWNNTRSNRSLRQSKIYDTSGRPDRVPDRSPTRSRSTKRSNTENQWLHDKFEEIHGEHSYNATRPTPKPVPAPKPILWSTIGKEVINGNTLEEKDCKNYSPNSAINQSPLSDTGRVSSPSADNAVNKDVNDDKERSTSDIPSNLNKDSAQAEATSPDETPLDLDC